MASRRNSAGVEVRLGGWGYLAASVHVEQAHPARQLLGVLDAVPQDAGGEIQGAIVRLRTQQYKKKTQKHKHVYLPARGANRQRSNVLINH